jgi:hypothetical protein
MNDARADSPYGGARVALLTQHGKERVVAPAFRELLSAEILVVHDVDTDALGTFTREVERRGTQLEAARRKAELACARSGLPYGLGSEGAFGPGPFGIGARNVEVIVFLDATRGLEVVGVAREPGIFEHAIVASRDELAIVAERAGFPEHALVVRPDNTNDPRIVKGLRSWDALHHAFDAALARATTGRVFVESDLRAHMHPSRMAAIGRAAVDLATRVASRCSACGAPGFGVAEPVAGRPCRDCGAPTRLPLGDDWACIACRHRERRDRDNASEADPLHCDACNP